MTKQQTFRAGQFCYYCEDDICGTITTQGVSGSQGGSGGEVLIITTEENDKPTYCIQGGASQANGHKVAE
jgi:hypothetical protein